MLICQDVPIFFLLTVRLPGIPYKKRIPLLYYLSCLCNYIKDRLFLTPRFNRKAAAKIRTFSNIFQIFPKLFFRTPPPKLKRQATKKQPGTTGPKHPNHSNIAAPLPKAGAKVEPLNNTTKYLMDFFCQIIIHPLKYCWNTTDYTNNTKQENDILE